MKISVESVVGKSCEKYSVKMKTVCVGWCRKGVIGKWVDFFHGEMFPSAYIQWQGFGTAISISFVLTTAQYFLS